jgi:hypothetical protein
MIRSALSVRRAGQDLQAKLMESEARLDETGRMLVALRANEKS